MLNIHGSYNLRQFDFSQVDYVINTFGNKLEEEILLWRIKERYYEANMCVYVDVKYGKIMIVMHISI